MKRLYKLIFINILLIFTVFILLEFITYKSELKKVQGEKSPAFNFLYSYYTNTKANWINTYKKIEKNEVNEIESGFRISQLPSPTHSTTKGTILLFGCSFTYGVQLDEFDTFSYRLQNYTNRLVLNRAFSGWGPASMLYQLRLSDFKNSLCFNLKSTSCNYGEVEYVIYTFITDHVRRNYEKCQFFDDKYMFYKYDKKSNSLVEKSNLDNFYYHSYILRKLYFYKYRVINKYNDDIKQFTTLHFTQSHKLIKQLFPHAKFIIFVYDGDNYIKPIQKELETDGISIIYLSDLSYIDFSQAEYKLLDGLHPNAKAWEIIVPLIAKKLNL